MKLERKVLCMLGLAAICWTGTKMTSKVCKNSGISREFNFTYSVSLPNLSPKSRSLRIWIPVAKTNKHQRVELLTMSGTIPLHIRQESKYEDRMAYAEIQHPRFKEAHFRLVYHVTRRSYSVGSFRGLMRENNNPTQITPTLKEFVQPAKLIPVDGIIRQVAEMATAGHHGEIAKAHAIYDYVFHHMRYEKSGTGWGHGNAVWACDAKRGNCTDFHSLFIGMMRAEGIPARFVIGFPLPPAKPQGTIPGYHCWAEFYVAGRGWVPVDISEAWLNPSQYGFFFGSVDANRFRFSVGRDITLNPKQSGPPVNYFVYPYGELDGKPYAGIQTHFTFRNTSH